MSFDYSAAGPWAQIVHALAMTETNEQPRLVGDGGRAFGILQDHPPFIAEYYRTDSAFPAKPNDDWITAEIKAAATFLDENDDQPLDLCIQAYNQGETAVFTNGVRAPEYLARFTANLNKLKGLAT